MKLTKYKYFTFSLVVIFSAISLVKGDSPIPPWSQVIPSTSGKYILVLISPKDKEQEEYISQSREFWRKGGIPADNVPEAEKALQKEIDKETAIRKKYSESGLYTAGKSPKLLWEIDLYDMRVWIRVSDDGENVIVGKWVIPGVIEEEPLEYNPEIKRVTKVDPNMEETILTFYFVGNQINSYKASELINVDENLQRNTNNSYVWSDEGILNEQLRTLSITKKNGEKLIFDMKGNLLTGKFPNQQSSNLREESNIHTQQENKRSFCGVTALLCGFLTFFVWNRIYD